MTFNIITNIHNFKLKMSLCYMTIVYKLAIQAFTQKSAISTTRECYNDGPKAIHLLTSNYYKNTYYRNKFLKSNIH